MDFEGRNLAPTFLFTDIEGSTRLWEHSPAEMRAALARHDLLLRAAIQHNNGFVFATGGDAFCAAFAAAPDALAAACAAQHALLRETWPNGARITVRMALHTGEAEQRDGDYFGPPLNRTARLLAAGHGGQILVSADARELLRDRLPDGALLRDLGERWLKDLIRPERIYQVVAPELPVDFPALRTLDPLAHNLPTQMTSFVGRDQEIEQVNALLETSRMVTLTGAGGAGKTRLALQLAADRVDDFPDGVWLVELAALNNAELVPRAVASALGQKEEPGVALTETLVRWLRTRNLLLILDNCEHLVEAAAGLCESLLAASRDLRILATSREALRIGAETRYRVPSLEAPGPGAQPSGASLAQFAAVQLFVERARVVQRSFQVTDANAADVANVCRRLDGIPLAIELAAARLRSLTVHDLNERLDQRFRLLTGGSRTALARQQTLRSAIDWSYDLLPVTERALLCRLSVFAGGSTLDATEAVCAGDGVEAGDVLDLLTALADKSLLAAEERDGAMRYRMLESVRQYASERLQGDGERPQWHARHLRYFVEFVEDAEPKLRGIDQQIWLDRIEADHDNLRAALEWVIAGEGDTGDGLRLASAVWWFWLVRGYLGEGRRSLEALLAAARDASPAMRARALSGAGRIAQEQSDYPKAREYHSECLELRRALHDRHGVAATLNNLGAIDLYRGDYPAARALMEESLAIRRDLGDRQGTAGSLMSLGLVAQNHGDYAGAHSRYAESVAIFRELGDRWGMAGALNNQGLVAFDRGDFPAARTLHEESLAIGRALADRTAIARSLNNLGEVAYAQGDPSAALRHFEESLAVFRELRDRHGTAATLRNIARIVSENGDRLAARTMLCESLGILREAGQPLTTAESLEALAIIEAGLSRFAQAARLWGAAQRIREELDTPLPPGERARYELQIADARAAHGDVAVFDQAWREGRALTLELAIECALATLTASDRPALSHSGARHTPTG